MFSKIIFTIISFFTLFQLVVGVALPGGQPSGGSTTVITNQCNVGTVSCCNQVQEASDPVTQLLGGLLGIGLGGVTGQVGVNCSPITVIGAGGNDCNAQPVCCSNNDFNGLINLGCSPINLNL